MLSAGMTNWGFVGIVKGFPLGGELSAKQTDEGAGLGWLSIRRHLIRPFGPPSPQGEGFRGCIANLQTQIDQSTSVGGQWPPALLFGSSPIDIRLDHSRPMALTTAAQRGQSSGWPSAVPMEGWWFQQRGHLGSSSSSTLTVRPGNASPQKPSPSP